MREATIKVFKYQELTGAAKDRARERLTEWNLDSDFWDGCFEGLKEDLKEIGIEAGKKIYFDTDRSRHAYCPDAHIVDEKVFLRAALKAGVKISKASLREALEDGMMLDDTGGRHPDMRVNINYDRHEGLTDYLQEFFYKFLKCVDAEYDYRCSEESLVEMAEANDYEWDEQGRPFRG